jgi:hypothetical protein
VTSPSDLSGLFHRLNNQRGIILANAELLEGKSDPVQRERANQLVSSVLDAMATARELRATVLTGTDPRTPPSSSSPRS